MPSGSEFGQVTSATIEELTRIFGAERIVSERAALARYARDQVFDPRYGHPADVAVKPATAGQLRELMLFASRERIPVTPRGAGSGLRRPRNEGERKEAELIFDGLSQGSEEGLRISQLPRNES